jgi:hypothetical protein
MQHKQFFIVGILFLLGICMAACQDRPHPTNPDTAASVMLSAEDRLATLLAPPNDWRIEEWCWYGEDGVSVMIYHPQIGGSVETGCSYTTASGSGTCTVRNDPVLCDCGWFPRTTSSITVTITGGSGPASLTHTFSVADAMPPLCEDDPVGWTMGPRCDPGGTLTISFAYPDSYDAVACDVISEDGTNYGCEIVPDARFSSLCVCHGVPVLGQHLIRQITLRDGTYITSQPRFTGINSTYCTFGIPPTESASSDKSNNPPPVQTCADQISQDACKMLGGCYWWSSGSCHSDPEPQQPPPPPGCDTYGDEKACTTNNCKWDPNAKPQCY